MLLKQVVAGLGIVCVVMSGAFAFFVGGNAKLRREVYEFQSFIETQQTEIVQKRQVLQAQQQAIEKGSAISGSIGPAVLKDIAELAVKNSNPRLRALLQSYGVEVRVEEAKGGAKGGASGAGQTQSPPESPRKGVN